MSDTFLDGRVTQHCGDVLAVLAQLPPDHFDCVVTSPPYWGLRDYGVDGQLGLEHSLGEHLAVMVKVFGEVRRVLKPTGTLWLNYGDCYATAPNGRSAADTKAAGNDDRTFRDKPFSTVGAVYASDDKRANGRNVGKNKYSHGATAKGRVVSGGYLKPKDLCMVPHRLAIALQNDGWWVRQDIVWSKPNPMPESITDRCTKAHEYIFLLTKSERYYFDANAIAEGMSAASISRLAQDVERQRGSDRVPGKKNGAMKAVGGRRKRGLTPRHTPYTSSCDQSGLDHVGRGEGRNKRSVWEVATQPFSEAHFATFPFALIEPCVLAGCAPGGEVLDCFSGAGTVGMVAASLGRRATLIELNPEYCTLARARIEAAFMGKDEGNRHIIRRLGKIATAGPLFGDEA